MFKFNFFKICDEQKIWEHEKTRKGRNICFISGGLKSLVDMSYIAYEAKEYFFFTLCELHEDYWLFLNNAILLIPLPFSSIYLFDLGAIFSVEGGGLTIH